MRFAYSCPFCSFRNETEAEHVKCEGSSSCRQHHYIYSHKAIHKFPECKLFTWALNNKHNKNATETTHACDREQTREIRIEMRRKKKLAHKQSENYHFQPQMQRTQNMPVEPGKYEKCS